MTENRQKHNPECALVTGGAVRIGKQIAIDLAALGHRVGVHYNRSADEAEALVEDIIQQGGQALAVQADLEDETALGAMMQQLADQMGPVTTLINNASVFEQDDPLTVSKASWDRHMQVNLRAPFVLSQILARHRPSCKTANIINIIDQRVWNLPVTFTSYTLSKYAFWGMTQTLARAFAPDIRVNAIGPGPTLPSIHQTEEEFKRQWACQPLSRPVTPEDISRAARFILDSPAMTGQMIAMDAGQHMGVDLKETT